LTVRSSVVAVLAAALVPSAAAGGVEAAEVTLRVDVRFDPGIQAREITLSGRIASGVAGELVEVQAKECGANRFYRLIGGTRTVGGGSWLLTNERGGVDLFDIPPNAYSARAGGGTSATSSWSACRSAFGRGGILDSAT
jgi:hypothetical protein